MKKNIALFSISICFFFTKVYAQKQVFGYPGENLPPYIERVTEFGERADWSSDGKKILFLEKTYGDIYEIDIENSKIRPLTHHYFHGGYTRALYLSNGDILASGSRTFDVSKPHLNRSWNAELWVLDAKAQNIPVPLGVKCFEGPAVSRKQLKIAWVNNDGNYDTIPKGFNFLFVADIEYSEDTIQLVNKNMVMTSDVIKDTMYLEPQNFIPPDDKFLTLSTYGYQGTEVFTVNIETGELKNITNTLFQYDEPEGIYPDGNFTLVESDKHHSVNDRKVGMRHIDIWKLSMKEGNYTERLTYFSDYKGFKGSNPVVSNDGKYIAFQLAKTDDRAGVGYGIFILDIEKKKKMDWLGRWEIIETDGLPVGRHENCFIEVNGKFYLLAGRGIRPVSVFDPKTNSWTNASKPPLELHHFQAIKYKEKIYIAGAMTGQYPGETPVDHIYIYHPEKDSWTKGDKIPKDRQRGSSGVVVYNNEFYFVCGIVDGHRGDYVTWVDKYNPESGKWTKLKDAPRPRDHFQAVVYEDKIYAVGGRTTSQKTGDIFNLTVPEVDIYDIKTNTWSSLPVSANLPKPRAGCSTLIIDDKLFVIGGESGTTWVAHADVHVLDLKTSQWAAYPVLKQGRHGTQAIFSDGKIYIASGCGLRGGWPELQTIEVYKVP